MRPQPPSWVWLAVAAGIDLAALIAHAHPDVVVPAPVIGAGIAAFGFALSRAVNLRIRGR